MPFTINGNVCGAQFNNVSGNLNQVSHLTQIFNSHGGHLGDASSRHRTNGIQGTAMGSQSTGIIRSPRGKASRRQIRPYDSANHSSEYQINNSHAPTAILNDTVPAYLGDRRNLSIDTVTPPQSHEFGDSIHDQFRGGSTFREGEEISTNTYTVTGNMTQFRVTSYGGSGLDILYHSIAMGAVHDSAERFADPACHSGTRLAILEQLSAWTSDTGRESTILWLHGSAGMGKSAIAQAFAGDCNNKDRLGASFFFKRGHPEQGSCHRLFTTIAYQLAISVPGLRLWVEHAVEANKLIVAQEKKLQFQRLIVEPLKQIPATEIGPVLVIDGLDECEDYKMQQDILRLFIDAIHEHELLVRLLITSRPEPHICEVIKTKETFDICRLMELSADEKAYEDIRTYLRDEFSRIRLEYLARGIDLGDMWPTPKVLEHLVKKSSAIFIYAATVIRFVGDQYSHPQEQLDSVLRLDPASTAPLDDLYSEILSFAKNNDPQRQLYVIWKPTVEQAPSRLTAGPEEIDTLLGLSRGISRLALRGLHSLLKIPPIQVGPPLRGEATAVNFLHASFADYLGDPRRSRGWCVDLPWLHSDYLHSMIHVLSVPSSRHCSNSFYITVVTALPKILSSATPCDHLFGLLRNTVFHNSLFHTPILKFPWPQRGSQYPSDLIQVWERHQFLSTFAKYMKLNTKKGSPTFKYDSVYRTILSGQSALVFVLSATRLLPSKMYSILRLFDLSYTIFEPFSAFREQLDVRAFSKGDSPVDFIADPHRAGALYLDLQDTAEVLLLRWFSRAAEVLVGVVFTLDL
ncbi:hypothetical protein B0H11DRAFT_1993816 [Mycena galericulata]|nr:hypothetical protein B0H11DRAFT_1993816 [Mycena galericulata]